MTDTRVWIAIALAAAGTYLLRLAGMLAGHRQADGEQRFGRTFEPVGPALIAAFLWVSVIPAQALPNWTQLGLQLVAFGVALWMKRRLANLGLALLAGLAVYAALLALVGR